MLSSSKIGTASWRYYQNTVAGGACEYYAGQGEAPGRWYGRGLAELGLTLDATVVEAQLEATFGRGIHPATGQSLGRAWRTDGITGYDLTFSAPKSVSTLWALGGTDIGREVRAAHRSAVASALSYLDTHASLSRRRRDGAEQVGSAGLAAALFEHRTSRAGDPQLHTHALVLNKVLCTDGKWRTIDGHEIYHHKKSAGMLYQAALRAELHRRLGVEFGEPNGHGQAEIAGVSQELLEAWSRRTKQIEAEATPQIATYENTLGRDLTAAERVAVVKTAVLKTRPHKQHEPESVLHARWQQEAAALGLDGETLRQNIGQAVETSGPAARSQPREVGRLVGEAVIAAGRRQAVFSRADLVAEIAARLPLTPATAERVRGTVEALATAGLARSEAVLLGCPPEGITGRRSDARYATAELLAAEARILGRVERGRQGGYGVADHAAARRQTAKAGLGPDQTAAVLAAVTSGDLVTVLTAPAGAGKTTALGAAAHAWVDSGYQVIGLAPSARAAAELGKALGNPSETVAKWLYEQHRTQTLPAGQRSPWQPTARTVLVVDEASMVSTHDLDTVTSIAEAAGAKVVLVGDPAQIGVIDGPGGMLGALAGRPGALELTAVRRFHQPWESGASLQLRRGDPAVLDHYSTHGRIHPADDGEAVLDAVFAQWSAERAAGHDALMMARARVDVDQLNARARAAALADGSIRGPELHVGERVWQAGDLLRTRRNDRRLPVGEGHVRNGDRYRVLGPTPEGGLLVEDLTGRGRTLLPATYLARHAEYGWASTIDGAQGATTDIGILLVRPGLDREHLYVGLTRGRQANHAHVTPEICADDAHHFSPPAEVLRSGGARRTLIAALARSGVQTTAHQLREDAWQRVDQRNLPHSLTRASHPGSHRRVRDELRIHDREHGGRSSLDGLSR